MKLINKWSQRLAVAVLSTTIAVSGGFVFSPQPTEAATVSAGTKINNVIALGDRYKGTPYRFGAKPWQTRNFDCSSFTQYVYGRYGVYLPRTAAQQAKAGRYVARGNWKRGDLLFFRTPGRSGVGHVAIYLGNNKILHATSSRGVRITPVTSYWNNRYVTARRVIA